MAGGDPNYLSRAGYDQKNPGTRGYCNLGSLGLIRPLRRMKYSGQNISKLVCKGDCIEYKGCPCDLTCLATVLHRLIIL
jgi:hypothetical protein